MYAVKDELEELIDVELATWEGMKADIKNLDTKLRLAEVPYINWKQ